MAKTLTKDQERAARALTDGELSLADLLLTRRTHGFTRVECLALSGITPARPDREKAYKYVASFLERVEVCRYMDAMRAASIKRTMLSLEYLDGELDDMIRNADIGKIYAAAEKGGWLSIKSVDELPTEVRMIIQEITPTRYGIKVKLYSRPDLMRMAYQRHGALTDNHIVTGAGGAPIASHAMDKEQYAKVRKEVLDIDDC